MRVVIVRGRGMSNVGLNYGIEMCVDKMYGNELCGGTSYRFE